MARTHTHIHTCSCIMSHLNEHTRACWIIFFLRFLKRFIHFQSSKTWRHLKKKYLLLTTCNMFIIKWILNKKETRISIWHIYIVTCYCCFYFVCWFINEKIMSVHYHEWWWLNGDDNLMKNFQCLCIWHYGQLDDSSQNTILQFFLIFVFRKCNVFCLLLYKFVCMISNLSSWIRVYVLLYFFLMIIFVTHMRNELLQLTNRPFKTTNQLIFDLFFCCFLLFILASFVFHISSSSSINNNI